MVAVAVLLGLVLGPPGGDGSERRSGLDAAKVPTGSSGTPHAVWVFGFRTVRLDPALRNPGQLPFVGFGNVVGADGRVYLYDPGTGRVGMIEAARNSLVDLGRVPGGTSERDPYAPALAARGGALWLVPRPGALVRFDLATRRAGPTLTLPVEDVGSVGTTAVAASGGAVVAATGDANGITVARVDANTGHVVRSTRVDAAGTGGSRSLDGLATDGASVWVLRAATVSQLDAMTLATIRTIRVPTAPGTTAKAAVVARGRLWMLVDNGSALASLDARSGAFTRALRLLTTTPKAFRFPASLTSDGRIVWAMVQTSADPDVHTVRIAGYDAARGAHTGGIDIPSALDAGAIAAS